MGDSFFGFNTNLPPLTDDELHSLKVQGINNNGDSEAAYHEHSDADIYDFETLRHELGVDDEQEESDGLGEEADDYNNITFNEIPTGQDFDFSSNTQQFSAAISEEEAFFTKKRSDEDQQVFVNPWAAFASREYASSNDHGRKFGQTSPVTSNKSIWGNFDSSNSPGSERNMSPFSPHSRATFHSRQQQHGFGGSMSPSISGRYQQNMHHYAANRNTSQPIGLSDLEETLVTGSMRATGYQAGHDLSPFGLAQPLSMGMLANQHLPQGLRERQELLVRNSNSKVHVKKSPYDGLMTQSDKDFINRIQLSQLGSGDPYADDFYYQVYSSLRQRAGLPLQPSLCNDDPDRMNANRGRRENMAQQNLQRIVNNAKRRPKQSQVSLEGALGTIASLTARNPRQVLQIPQASNSSSTSAEPNTPNTEDYSQTVAMDQHQILKVAEDIYTVILELEQMRRQGPPQHLSMDEEGENDLVETFNQKHAATASKLWDLLRLNESDEIPFLIRLLSVSKGKKSLPRVMRQLTHDQNRTLLNVFMSNFSMLQVCRYVIYPGTAVADVDEAKSQKFIDYGEIELFMNTAAPPLLAFIAESPLSTLIELLQLFLQKNDIMVVTQTKPGLAILTMILSRAEILKQGGGSVQGLPDPSTEELDQWQGLYTTLFDELKGNYLHIYPSMYYLVSLNPNISMVQVSHSVDDMYVWEFLAAMAVGASMDQQHILVTEIRDRVMENIILAKRNRVSLDQANHRISNVNLFLHALGLDASQVSVPV